jgi:hypothetical protein
MTPFLAVRLKRGRLHPQFHLTARPISDKTSDFCGRLSIKLLEGV